MEKRNKKRTVIISVYAFLMLGVATWIYSATRPAPSCSDNIQNQNEEKVDCGWVCDKKCPLVSADDLALQKSGFVEGSASDQFDLFAYVANPNNELGSRNFHYEFVVTDSDGNVTARKNGESFILPGEKKYIVDTDVKSSSYPAKVALKIKNTSWDEFKQYQERPQLKIVNKRYTEMNSPAIFSEASGLLKNESPFDFRAIRIQILLKNESGEIIALNSTQINTVKSGENREFKALWPRKFSGQVSNVEVQPEVNVFDELGI